MKKHVDRLVLLIGLIILLVAFAVMVSQTIGRKRTSLYRPVSEQSTFSISS